MESRIILVLALACYCIQVITAEDCPQQMDRMRTCIRNQMAQDVNDSTASDQARRKVEADMRACCFQAACQDPFPNAQERSAREACFVEANSNVRNQLQACIRRQDNSFQLPGDDNNKDAYWNFEMLRVTAAMKNIGDNKYNKNRGNKNKWPSTSAANDVCQNDDNKKSQVTQCLRSRNTLNVTSHSKSKWRRNSCKIKRDCQSQAQVSQQCKQNWNYNHMPKICDCVSQFLRSNDNTLKNIQSSYYQCLRNKNVRLQNENGDDGRVVIKAMVNDWCPNGVYTKPTNDTDRCNRRRGQGSNNNGNNGNNNGNNGQNNGQNGNTQSNTNANVDEFDDGTSVQASSNVDAGNPFDSMLGGTDAFASPLSSLGGGGGLGGLSSLTGGGSPLGGLGGGLGGLSSLTGGGSPLGGLGGLSSLTGGGSPLGGLSSLGGGGPLAGLLGGGASPLGALGGDGGLAGIGGGVNVLGGLGGLMKKK